MNHLTQNSIDNRTASAGAPTGFEDTLRLMATLPAPAGLEDRLCAGLSAAPRRARVLGWPGGLHTNSGWMRGAAAAAIVFVVAGGGWGIYRSAPKLQAARTIVMPPRVSAPGGFSNAGAMRTPNTLNGPVVVPAPALVAVAPGKAAAKAQAQKPARPVPGKGPVKTAEMSAAGAVK